MIIDLLQLENHNFNLELVKNGTPTVEDIVKEYFHLAGSLLEDEKEFTLANLEEQLSSLIESIVYARAILHDVGHLGVKPRELVSIMNNTDGPSDSVLDKLASVRAIVDECISDYAEQLMSEEVIDEAGDAGEFDEHLKQTSRYVLEAITYGPESVQE